MGHSARSRSDGLSGRRRMRQRRQGIQHDGGRCRDDGGRGQHRSGCGDHRRRCHHHGWRGGDDRRQARHDRRRGELHAGDHRWQRRRGAARAGQQEPAAVGRRSGRRRLQGHIGLRDRPRGGLPCRLGSQAGHHRHRDQAVPEPADVRPRRRVRSAGPGRQGVLRLHQRQRRHRRAEHRRRRQGRRLQAGPDEDQRRRGARCQHVRGVHHDPRHAEQPGGLGRDQRRVHAAAAEWHRSARSGATSRTTRGPRACSSTTSPRPACGPSTWRPSTRTRRRSPS